MKGHEGSQMGHTKKVFFKRKKCPHFYNVPVYDVNGSSPFFQCAFWVWVILGQLWCWNGEWNFVSVKGKKWDRQNNKNVQTIYLKTAPLHEFQVTTLDKVKKFNIIFIKYYTIMLQLQLNE